MHKIFNIVRAIVQEVGWSDGNEDMLPGEGRKREREGEREGRRGKVRRGRTENNFITNSDNLIELTNVVGKAVSQHHGRYKITGKRIIRTFM